MSDSTQLVLPSDADRAYAAGFFDGEGCISISAGSAVHKTPRAVLTISQNTRSVLQWHQDRWSGTIWDRPAYADRSHPGWHWHLSESLIAAFLRDVRPWLIVKAELAVSALEFLALKATKGSLYARPTPKLRAQLIELQGRHAALQTRYRTDYSRRTKAEMRAVS